MKVFGTLHNWLCNKLVAPEVRDIVRPWFKDPNTVVFQPALTFHLGREATKADLKAFNRGKAMVGMAWTVLIAGPMLAVVAVVAYLT